MRREADDIVIAAILAKWQERLGLQAWRITIRFVRWWEIEGDFGRCAIQHEGRLATIEVLHPDDAPPSELANIEHTIVHELMHILFVGLEPPDDTAGVLLEQAINVVSSVLTETPNPNRQSARKPRRGARATS